MLSKGFLPYAQAASIHSTLFFIGGATTPQGIMANNDEAELESLLDSALEDFKVDMTASPSRSTEMPGTALGQGLGKGLPSLAPVKKKSTQKSTECTTSGAAATLEKLAEQTRSTVQSMDAQSPDEQSEEAFIESMAKQFESLGTQDIENIMGTFMQQILSKEILHEPMKEIGERYPPWLEANKSKLSEEDYSRYSKQYNFIVQLCQVYDSTPDDFQKIVDLMQNMQSCGQPPSEIVEELAPGLQLGEDGLPVLPNFPMPPGAAGGEGDRANCCIM